MRSVAGGSVGIRSTLRRGCSWREHGGMAAIDDPSTRTALDAHQAGGLRWLGGGVIAIVLGVLLGAVVAVVGNTGRRIPGAGLPAALLIPIGTIAAVAGAGALLRDLSAAPRPVRDVLAGRTAAHGGARDHRLRAPGYDELTDEPVRSVAAHHHRGLADAGGAADGRRRGAGRTGRRRPVGARYRRRTGHVDRRPDGRPEELLDPVRGVVYAACSHEKMTPTCAAGCTWTRRRHGQAQGEERAPGWSPPGAESDTGGPPLMEFTSSQAGSLSPFGEDHSFPLPADRSATRTRPTSPTGPACRWWKGDEHARAAVLQRRTSTVPLLGDTIGANLDRTGWATTRRWSRRLGRRFSYPEFVAVSTRASAGRPGRRQGRPGRHLGAELRRVGLRPVRDGEVGRDPGQHQPGLPHPRAGLRAEAGRHLGAGERASSRPATTGRWWPRCAATAPTCGRCCSSAIPTGSGCSPPAAAATAQLLVRREAELSADDPINIQHTSGTTASKGATLTHHNLLNNGFFGEGCAVTEADRICIPVPYYHCFGMGMGNLAATSHGATMVIPAPGSTPRRR